MKIDGSSKVTTDLSKVIPGDIFIFTGDVYIMTNNSRESKAMCVNLRNGHLATFRLDTVVETERPYSFIVKGFYND